MAARRLIFVLLVLFAISVVAAALAPDRGGLFSPSTAPTSTSTTTTTTTDAQIPPDSPSRRARLTASHQDPPQLRAEVGEQLELLVASERFRDLAIDRLGLTGFAQPAAPARFDLLLRAPGAYPITDAAGGATVASIKVTRPGAAAR